MPNRDRTGPEGKGPLTGRKKGKCVSKKATKKVVKKKTVSKKKK
jgi:hypothetical protein